MEESQNDLAIRIWSNSLSLENAKTPSGKESKLLSVPFYYVCLLPRLLDSMLDT